MKNHGLDYEKEIASHSPEDWIVGAVSFKPLVYVPFDKRQLYLPMGEVQRGAEDTMDCASRAPHNILEMDLLYGIADKKFSAENGKWLFDKGYAFYDKDEVLRVEVSDAFTGILSGTTESGNSLKAPLESIRKNGLIPKKMLPLLSDMTFAQYMNRDRITPAMIALGEEFNSRFLINYEKMDSGFFEKNIKESCIIVGGYAWGDVVNGEYPAIDAPPNHAFVLYGLPEYVAFDNYIDGYDGDFSKKLAANYKFMPYGYRIFIQGEAIPVQLEKRNWFINLIKELICKMFQRQS